nr:bifunctional DNA primase/helicase [Rathayibacter agropyri]
MLQIEGHGSPAVLYPLEVLATSTAPVILCEGEMDALKTLQESGGQFLALTGTGGAHNPPRDLSPLAGREVFVAYDADDAGRKGAQKVRERLVKAGATAHILDLTRLGLTYSENHGEDLTNYWMNHGGTVGTLVAEIERLRKANDEDDEEDDITDPVLAAMEAAFLSVGEVRNDSFASLVSEEEMLTRPPLEYIVEPFVPRGMHTVMFGAPGSFKTFAMQDLASRVRTGMPFHDAQHPTVRGAVLLLEAEGLQQFQARTLAWRQYYEPEDMAAIRFLDEPLDLSSPEGAANLVRTLLLMEEATGEKVELVAVDPAALYMAGSENEDGNFGLAVGLNAVAKYLDIGVLLIVHTNASGERARGTDHFRMLSGSYIRVEKLEGGQVGMVQEKVKNAEPRALVFYPEPAAGSVVLKAEECLTAAQYNARKFAAQSTERAKAKLSESRSHNAVKTDKASEMILDLVREQPGLTMNKVLEALRGNGIGSANLNATRENLIAQGQLIIRIGPKSAQLHYLPDAAPPPDMSG